MTAEGGGGWSIGELTPAMLGEIGGKGGRGE